MFYQTRLRSIILLVILIGLAIFTASGGYFASEIVIEIVILAIMAVSLDVVAGYGGMVSLCHGAIMGISAYCYAIFSVKFGWPNFPSALAALGVAAVYGTLVGWITGRTSGIYFIMATLAFGQMAYTVIFKSRWLGGDDGLGGIERFDLSAIGIDLGSSVSFGVFALLCLFFTYMAAAWLLSSGFGRTLSAIHSNEDRIRAIGVNTVLHRARAMGFSALLAGIAGIISAQHTMYISPELLVWMVSGEVLIIVILGGLGTLIGPIIGAVIFVFIRHEVSGFTNYWHMVIGFILIATVLAGGRGIYGQFEYWWAKRKAAPLKEEAQDA